MIKTAFKNYFYYFKYFFLCLAIIYTAILLSGLIVFFGVLPSVKSASIPAYQGLINHFGSYTTFNFLQILRADFLNTILNELKANLYGLADFSVRSASFLLALAALILIGSLKIAQMLAKAKIRKRVSTKNSLKGLLVIILRFIAWAIFYAVYIVITYYWFFAIFLLPFVSLIISNFENLFVTWAIYFRKEVKFRKIFNFKSVLRLTGSNLILQFINVILIIMIAFLNVLAALLIALPLLSYTYAVTDITSARYFLDKQAKGELKDKNI